MNVFRFKCLAAIVSSRRAPSAVSSVIAGWTPFLRLVRSTACALIVAAIPFEAPAAQLWNLGFTGGGSDMSQDGSVVVGALGQGGGGPFRWTAAGGVQVLGANGQAAAVSADGSVISGKVDNRPFRWTASGGMESIASVITYPWAGFGGGDMSFDGTTIVGSYNEGSGPRAYKWSTTAGFVTVNSGWSSLERISGDGRFGVGFIGDQPARWDLTTNTYQLLETRSGYYSVSGISADGATVVGAESVIIGTSWVGIPWYWTSSTGRVPMTPPRGGDFINAAVSPDGRYVSLSWTFASAWLFDRQTQIYRNMADIFRDEGLPALGEYNIFSVSAITGDAVRGYNVTGVINPGNSTPTAYAVTGIFAGTGTVPEIDPAGLGSVLALVTGSLGLLERRRRARR